MSRDLGRLLGADAVAFRQQIAELERVAGLPSADIRLSMDVMQATRQKLRELGLDPSDTTGPELYAVLQSKLRRDEIQVRAAMHIRADIPPVQVQEHVCAQLNAHSTKGDLYVLRPASLKRMLKKLKPKTTMKKLGYRSMESMFKHEAPAQLLAACLACESADWQSARVQAYAALESKDFELRRPLFVLPAGKKWPEVAQEYAEKHKSNIVVMPELGSIVILPMSRDLPGLAITTFVVALYALNSIRSFSTYLKLQQVRLDFGTTVQSAVLSAPMTDMELAGAKISWRVVHWFYAKGHGRQHPEAFEPHVQPEDLTWHAFGPALQKLSPVLSFWQDTELLGLLDNDNDDVVSLNVMDVALGVCNKLAYGERVLQTMREALGQELLARYFHEDHLQTLLERSLGTQLAPEVDFTS
jgi:hypothetical protein